MPRNDFRTSSKVISSDLEIIGVFAHEVKFVLNFGPKAWCFHVMHVITSSYMPISIQYHVMVNYMPTTCVIT
jgi:hypothetical protein